MLSSTSIILIGCLVFAGSAEARAHPRASVNVPHSAVYVEGLPRVQTLRWARIAKRYWHTQRAPGCQWVTISTQDLRPLKLAGLASPCAIAIDPTARRGMVTWEACQLLVHEWGHLLGYQHSMDPTSIMFAGQNLLIERGTGPYRYDLVPGCKEG